jgi:lipopolysaccharide transport system ATP-binding protein
MNDIVIRTEHLSKKYKIGTRSRSYKTLRDTLSSVALSPIHALSGLGSNVNRKDGKHDDFIWALKDISFEVKRGDVVGIIGRNGAGKSTLLKILSRITEPTSGFADISGRVGSLLEVGTGFHPELTGRENIYLNGAILGMRKSELDRKFDEIVAFAAVETFIDTPVKHYSSGMFLRLAFAVAAHLEPQILLVDEVLAVGDAMFQKKCLGKMGEVAKEGRTVLFVSHNMGAMRSLCNKAIVLENSRVIHDGEVSKGIESYYRAIGLLRNDDNDISRVSGSFRQGFDGVSIKGGGNTVRQHEAFEVSTTLSIDQRISGFNIFCIIESLDGTNVAMVRQNSTELDFRSDDTGRFNISVQFPPLWLNTGLYSLYFKALLWGDQCEARYLSDKFPMDVSGESSLTQAILQPQAEWSITEAEPAVVRC